MYPALKFLDAKLKSISNSTISNSKETSPSSSATGTKLSPQFAFDLFSFGVADLIVDILELHRSDSDASTKESEASKDRGKHPPQGSIPKKISVEDSHTRSSKTSEKKLNSVPEEEGPTTTTTS